jgi:hypothetical protein
MAKNDVKWDCSRCGAKISSGFDSHAAKHKKEILAEFNAIIKDRNALIEKAKKDKKVKVPAPPTYPNTDVIFTNEFSRKVL